ncbi:hypothetical protein [Lysinibacillus capsici]|uniref:hypothetical protein n=1 Tax=Lysinibacillus capsici TaxID=2115968 RepID=UPI002DB844AF|nr:hypothetical protein [Lysinibacillus capsici]MEC1305969.1 hypothetical protein [Lysinibacillus capsici]
MDVKVRNVDVLTVKKLDELAKKQGKSREGYLREQLNRLAYEDLQSIEQERFENILKKNQEILQASIFGQDELLEKLNALETILMIVLDTDMAEINETLDIWKGGNESG